MPLGFCGISRPSARIEPGIRTHPRRIGPPRPRGNEVLNWPTYRTPFGAQSHTRPPSTPVGEKRDFWKKNNGISGKMSPKNTKTRSLGRVSATWRQEGPARAGFFFFGGRELYLALAPPDRPESTGIDPQAMPRLLMRRPRPPREVVLCAHFLFKRLAGAKNGCFCQFLRPSPPSRGGCPVTRWGSYLIRIDWVQLDQKATVGQLQTS